MFTFDKRLYYEYWDYFDLAISREKEFKKWNRAKKEQLINQVNPGWKELVNDCGFVRDSERSEESNTK